MTERARTSRYDAVSTNALVVAALFVLIGVLGFVPGITTDFADLSFAGRESEAKLLGLFQVSVLHNVVHLASGLVGLAVARRADSARLYLIVGGLIYLVLWIYGIRIDQDGEANFLPVNDADNWLHFFLGVGMVLLGFVTTRDRGRRATVA